jgi:hypothetical protein
MSVRKSQDVAREALAKGEVVFHEEPQFDPFANGEEPSNREPKISFPPLVNGLSIKRENIKLPPEIINSLLSRCEKFELAGGAKSFKTWALIDQSLAIASGKDWWGFHTSATNVIYLNLEIPQPFFEERLCAVAKAREIAIPSTFNVWHLRGQRLYDANRWLALLLELRKVTAKCPNPLLVTDPVYKLLGGRNENAAGDVQSLLEQLEDAVQATDGANTFGHHFSKGNQALKEPMDRASGSGVFQRDPDTLFTMTSHQKETAFSINPIVRNHPPINEFVVEWEYPLFVRNEKLDPQELKQPKKSGPKAKFNPEHLLKLLKGQVRTKDFSTLVMEKKGMSRALFFELLKEAEQQKLIIRDEIAGTWKRSRA